MTHVFHLIRHGESSSNAGHVTTDTHSVSLTQKGLESAAAAARAFPSRPDLVVVSPYIRTRQTAAPFLERFEGVPVEEWEIQEFTYMDTRRYDGTTGEQRLPFINSYWESADPNFEDGNGESFNAFAARCHRTIARMGQTRGITLAFSHGHMMRGILFALAGHFDRVTPDTMRDFWHSHLNHPIANCTQMDFDIADDNRVTYRGEAISVGRTNAGQALID